MEDALHGKPQGMVVGIDRFAVGAAASWVKRPRSGEDGFDGFVAENEEGGNRQETAGERFVAAGVAMRQTMCLPRTFFRSQAAWRGPYCAWRSLPRARTRAARSEAVKPLGEGDKAISASITRRMRG